MLVIVLSAMSIAQAQDPKTLYPNIAPLGPNT